MSHIRRACFFAMLAASWFGNAIAASGADEFVPPPPAERAAFAALRAKGASVQIDGEYRVVFVWLDRRCTNDEVKLLPALERLTKLQLLSDQIDDGAVETLKALPKLTSIMILRSSISEQGLAVLHAAMPSVRITVMSSQGAPPSVVGSGVMPTGSASFSASDLGLSTHRAVLDDLKPTPEQRQRVREASDVSAFIRTRDERVRALLTPEQLARLEQLELQRQGGEALARNEIAGELKLTDQQRSAIGKLIAEAASELSEANNELRSGPPTPDRTAKYQQRSAEILERRDEKINGLLNDDQRQAWQAKLGPKGPRIPLALPVRSLFGQTGLQSPARTSASGGGATTSAAATPRSFPRPGLTPDAKYDEVEAKFVPSGITAQVGGYRPLRAELSTAADDIKTPPADLQAPKYGKLRLDSHTWHFVLDEPAGQPARLFVDANGDGDLTNDPPPTWSAKKLGDFQQYSGTAQVDQGSGQTASVQLYRFDPSDPRRASLKNTLMYYPDFGYELTLVLDGQKFTAAVPAESGPIPIWIDRDHNQIRSTKREVTVKPNCSWLES